MESQGLGQLRVWERRAVDDVLGEVSHKILDSFTIYVMRTCFLFLPNTPKSQQFVC